MIEPRIYRAAFIPAVLALVLTMFSLQSRPAPLAQGLAADVVFEGTQGLASARQILSAAPDRRAGSAGDQRVASMVADGFRARGFSVQRDRFEHDGKQLINVVGRRQSGSGKQVVVLAARDASGVPDAAGSAADTGALLELARVFEGRPTRKSLTLASVDGETLGQVGARRLASELGPPGQVAGVIVLSGTATPGSQPAEVQAWSTDTRRAGLGLMRTVTDSLAAENDRAGPGSSPFGQFARLAFPLGVGSQAPLIADGYNAVRISGDGELATGNAKTTADQLDEERFARLGRAALRSLAALDQGAAPAHGPRTYVTAVSQVLSGGTLALLSFALVLPALVASIDAFARARRRREPLGGWLAWLGAGVLPFLIGLLLAKLLAIVGLFGEPPPGPVAPALYPLGAGGVVALVLVAAVVVGSWFGLRFLIRNNRGASLGKSSAPGAAVAVALVLSACALALWAVNPYAALLLAPALHLWLLATLVDPPPPRGVRFAMAAGGLLLPALLALYVLLTLKLDPLSGLWYLLLMVTGGQVGLAQVLIACVLAGVAGSVASIARHRPVDGSGDLGPSVRGPQTYLGPGSLGGTKSALPRR